jgi:hypothetical protein
MNDEQIDVYESQARKVLEGTSVRSAYDLAPNILLLCEELRTARTEIQRLRGNLGHDVGL